MDMFFSGSDELRDAVKNFISYINQSGVSTLCTQLKPETLKQLNFLKDKIELIKETAISSILSDELQYYIEEVRENENLTTTEFRDKYSEDIDICKTIGESGWVISSYTNPRIIREWYNYVNNDNNEGVVELFEKDEKAILNSIIENLKIKYADVSNSDYFFNGVSAFKKEDYMTSAIYLVALLDSRINKLMNYARRMSYRQKFSDEGFYGKISSSYDNTNSLVLKKYYILYVYPSLIAFLKRLFVDDIYTFESNNEPPYINRNWLLHGRSTRVIKRYECIQIFNALHMMEELLDVQ